MLHKAWNSKGEMPYCFPRSSIKFQGHTGQNITDFDPNWAFPDYRPVAAFKSLRFALFWIRLIQLDCIISALKHSPVQVGWCHLSFAVQKSLPEASFGLRVLSLPASVHVGVNHELVRAITCDWFQLESTNLNQTCKTSWLRSLLFWGLIDLDLQGQI